jgi:hypothetical protein
MGLDYLNSARQRTVSRSPKYLPLLAAERPLDDIPQPPDACAPLTCMGLRDELRVSILDGSRAVVPEGLCPGDRTLPGRAPAGRRVTAENTR